MKKLYFLFILLSCSLMSYSQSDCASAVSAIDGLNGFSAIAGEPFWFTYELPSGKKASFTSTHSGEIRVSSGAECYSQTNYTYGNTDVVFSALDDGGTLYIRINPYTTGTFEYDLTISDLLAGDNCNLATSAIEGMNSFEAEATLPRWFKFELPENKKLILTSSNNGEVGMFSGSDCDDRNNYTSGNTDVSFIKLSSGGTIFIEINPYNTETFEFELTVSDFETGDNCELANQAVEGVNSFPPTTNSIYWYKYTMAETGNLNIDFNGYNQYDAYRGSNCTNLSFIAGSSSSKTLTNLTAGDNIYFEWNSNGNFDFTLTEEPPFAGQNCDLAETAVDGTNSIPAVNVDYFWYKYTMPTELNQKLIIEAGNDRDITVYSGNCESLSSIGNSDGTLKVLGIASDDEVYIRIQTNRSGDFDWNLSLEPEGLGDSCENPEEAFLGDNFTPVSPHWFTYTAPVAGDYIISSVGMATQDTYLRVYSDCLGSLIDSNDDFDFSSLQSELSLDLTEGQTIHILWDDVFNGESFDWSISTDAVLAEGQTIIFGSIETKTYGDANFDLTALTTSDLSVSFTSSNTDVATVSGSTVSIVGAGTTTITASQEGNDYFNAATPVEQTFSVAKANQTITFDPITDREVGEANFSIPTSVSSGLDLSYNVAGPATLSGDMLSLTGETGTVTVTASQNGDDNYNAAEPVTVEFLVTDPAKTDQTITFEELEPRTYGVLAISLSGSTDSGLSLNYESSNPSVASIDGNLVVINTAGSTTITARQDGNGTYNPATPVSRELVINKANQTINVFSIGGKEVTEEPFDVNASVTSGLNLTYTVEGPATISGKTITLGEEAGTVTVTVSQAGNINYNPASESVSFEVSNSRSDQTISITDIPDKFVTDAPFEVEGSTTSELALTYEVSGPATIDGTTITLDGSTGTVEVTVSQAGNENFNPATASISFEVIEDPCVDFAATATATNLICAGSADGSITVETTEGTAPFTYSLEGAAAVESNEFTALEAREYSIVVTDANGCTATASAAITSPDALEITAEVENSNSINGNGSISLTVAGGTGDYTYSWSNEATTALLTELEVGEYTVEVTDENGCSIEESFTIGGVTANSEDVAEGLLIFPNPAKDVVNLQHGEKIKSLKLYDARGKLLNEMATEGGTTEMNVSQLPSGLYFIRQDRGSQLYRFVKK